MYLFEQITRAYGYLIKDSQDDILQLECPNGHLFNCTIHAFKQGRRCQICQPSPWRHTTNEIKNILAIEGYSLVSNNYINQTTKMDIKCSKNHEYKTTWQRFRKGFRCPHCAGNYKKTFEEIEDTVKSVGYKLLSDRYLNNKTKLKIECDKGHQIEMSWHKFQQGVRCGECYKNRTNKRE